MAVKRGLGRGLDALIRDDATPEKPAAAGGILRLPVARIRRSALQPRRTFGEERLDELAASIRERGVIQPLLVRSTPEGYELVAGERRLRAAVKAGLSEVPVLIVDAADRDALELALVENLQREDLNAIEEAEGYQTLSERFGLTQEDIASRVGKARASVANAVRLLALPHEVKELVRAGRLSPGHAKALTALAIPEEQVRCAVRASQENLSVREIEALIQRISRPPRKPRACRDDLPAKHLQYLSDELHGRFGTSVRITPSGTYANGKKRRGCMEIDFYSNEELERILQLLGVGEEREH